MSLQNKIKAGRPQGVDLFGKDVQHNYNGDQRKRRNGGKRQSVYVLVLLGRRRDQHERGGRVICGTKRTTPGTRTEDLP